MVRVRLSDATLVGSVMDFLRLSSLDPKRVEAADDLLEVTIPRATLTTDAEVRLVSVLVHAWHRKHRFDGVAEVTGVT